MHYRHNFDTAAPTAYATSLYHMKPKQVFVEHAWFESKRPSLYIDFGAPSVAIQYSRAGSATVVNDQGIIEAVGTDVPRYDHDPLTRAPIVSSSSPEARI